MIAKISRVIDIITTTVIVIAIAFSVFLLAGRPFGCCPYVVMSGSMEPEYPTGSLIYTKSVEAEELQIGDVITFTNDSGTVVTHRIVEVIPDSENPSILRFQTQGDANDVADGSLVHCANVLGTPVLCVPYLGQLLLYIQEPPGFYNAIAVVALFIALIFLPDVFSKEEEEKEPTKIKKKEIHVSLFSRNKRPVGKHAAVNIQQNKKR